MFADALMFILFIGMALYGAWATANTRHQHSINHKRRHTDH